MQQRLREWLELGPSPNPLLVTRPGLSRPSTSYLLCCCEDLNARHNGPVRGPAQPDPSAGHDGTSPVKRTVPRSRR